MIHTFAVYVSLSLQICLIVSVCLVYIFYIFNYFSHYLLCWNNKTELLALYTNYIFFFNPDEICTIVGVRTCEMIADNYLSSWCCHGNLIGFQAGERSGGWQAEIDTHGDQVMERFLTVTERLLTCTSQTWTLCVLKHPQIRSFSHTCLLLLDGGSYLYYTGMSSAGKSMKK